MATKLKNLKVTKVDFVDQGANPDAHVVLFKRKEGSAGKEPEKDGDKSNVLKRLFEAIAKMVSMKPEELNNAVEQIEKSDAKTFSEAMSNRRNQKIADEMWDICFALHSSLCSIMWDEEVDSVGAAASMLESIDEFCTVAKDSVSQWSNGKEAGVTKSKRTVTNGELKVMKAVYKKLSETIVKASAELGTRESVNKGEKKGIIEMSMIDKSKLTDAERAFLEDIEKRCTVEKTELDEEEDNKKEKPEKKIIRKRKKRMR